MIRAALASLLIAAAAQVSAQSLEAGPVTPSPWDDYLRAVELFNAGERVLAGCVMYRGQFRARLLLTVRPNLPADREPAIFASLQESVARPINEWLGGDRDDWIAAMQCARDWAAENDDPDISRARAPQAYREVLAGLDELIASIPAKAQLRAQRRANGLSNR